MAIRRIRLLGVAILAGSGCCGMPAPAPEKYFHRGTPDETLRGFVYAVDTHHWEYAWGCLTGPSRDEIGSQLRFQVAIRYLDEPSSGVPLYELVTSALRLRGRAAYSPDRTLASIRVYARGKNSEGTIVFKKVDLTFERAGEEWLLDLLRSFGIDPSTRNPAPEAMSAPSA